MSYIGETFGEKEMLRFFCDQFAMSAFASSSILQERRKLWLKLMGQNAQTFAIFAWDSATTG